MNIDIAAAPEESPETAAKRLIATQRRRRARRQFLFGFLLTAIFISWMVNDFLAPDVNSVSLSAKLAPSAPEINFDRRDMVPMQRRSSEDQLKKGDSLAALLARNGVAAGEAQAALDSLKTEFDARNLQPGQKVRVFRAWPPGDDAKLSEGQFAGFDLIPEPRQKVIVQRLDDGRFETTRQNRPLNEKYFVADTLITSSVYEAARSSGVAPNLVADLIRLFSFSVDFQRDIREGDQLEVLYTRRFDQNNQLAEEGEIIFVALTNRGQRLAYWLHNQDDEEQHYYDEQGRSVQRLLMRTPVDGARLSSRYGMRRHPILGYTRLHRGLDFAAPVGTPIYAAGDGQVTKIGRYGDSGLYIKLRHNDRFETAYAHMNGFAKGLKKGDKVKQGQVIGYVGRTGLATGPHLHYEVLQGNMPVNPRSLNLPPRQELSAQQLAAFETTRTQAAKRIGTLASRNNSLTSLPR
jgi:murein DD-endopeptidase MepM/ murein hydrolase activator NlpD